MKLTDRARRASSGWKHYGQERPPFAKRPRQDQESVWDYPRPPRIEKDRRHIIVRSGRTIIAETDSALRVLETASPPTFYLPPESVLPGRLESGSGLSLCEWKGQAVYWDVVLDGRRLAKVAWSYCDPFPGFETLRDYVSFYPAPVECFVGDERVRPQPGRFYGGWVTSEIVGPLKGESGSEGW